MDPKHEHWIRVVFHSLSLIFLLGAMVFIVVDAQHTTPLALVALVLYHYGN